LLDRKDDEEEEEDKKNHLEFLGQILSSKRQKGLHNLVKRLAANEGEVLLHGELWRSGDREILINERIMLKKRKKIFNQWRK